MSPMSSLCSSEDGEVVLLYASNRRMEGWVYLEVGGPVELLKWRSASTLEAAPMWVSPTHLQYEKNYQLFIWAQVS